MIEDDGNTTTSEDQRIRADDPKQGRGYYRSDDKGYRSKVFGSERVEKHSDL
jgi:hypothetical protein